ncbi:hypothetical protein V8C37DRAFT_5642 [Trichoderma ceciliae]
MLCSAASHFLYACPSPPNCIADVSVDKYGSKVDNSLAQGNGSPKLLRTCRYYFTHIKAAGHTYIIRHFAVFSSRVSSAVARSNGFPLGFSSVLPPPCPPTLRQKGIDMGNNLGLNRLGGSRVKSRQRTCMYFSYFVRYCYKYVVVTDYEVCVAQYMTGVSPERGRSSEVETVGHSQCSEEVIGHQIPFVVLGDGEKQSET